MTSATLEERKECDVYAVSTPGRPWAALTAYTPLQQPYDIPGGAECPSSRLNGSRALQSGLRLSVIAPILSPTRFFNPTCTMLHGGLRPSCPCVLGIRAVHGDKHRLSSAAYTSACVYAAIGLGREARNLIKPPTRYTRLDGFTSVPLLPVSGLADGLDHWVYIFLFMYTNSSSR